MSNDLPFPLFCCQMKHILALCGSTRKISSNLAILRNIQSMTSAKFTVEIFESIDQIPHFNPDLDVEPAPEAVTRFRQALSKADGILICTPEYAMGVPGTLKNAIDWTVSSSEFSHKPTALITASSIGEKGHASLMETLTIIEANITDDTQLVIPFVRSKVDASGQITDEAALQSIVKLMNHFHTLISQAWFLR